MSPLTRPMRSLANGLGLAWWARVQTQSPDVTYWFGPFVRRSTLERELSPFLDDLKSEAPASLVGREGSTYHGASHMISFLWACAQSAVTAARAEIKRSTGW